MGRAMLTAQTGGSIGGFKQVTRLCTVRVYVYAGVQSLSRTVDAHLTIFETIGRMAAFG
jgi:hypothetical protein